jgi:hypothetical protein
VIQQRVFLDANILFSIAYGSDGLERVCGLAKKLKFELLASQYVIEEAVRNLDRQDQRDALCFLPPNLPRPIIYSPAILPILDNISGKSFRESGSAHPETFSMSLLGQE